MQPQAALERIAQPDKLRDDRKKNLKSEILYLDETYQQNSPNDFDLIESPISQTNVFVDLPQVISNSVIDLNFENILQSFDGFDELSLDPVFDSVVLNFDSSFDLEINFVLVIFVVLVFFLFMQKMLNLDLKKSSNTFCYFCCNYFIYNRHYSLFYFNIILAYGLC